MEETVGRATVTVDYDADPDDTIECFRDVRERYEPQLRDKMQEHLYALFLDSTNTLITDQMVAKGEADKVNVPKRAIVRSACLVNAVGVIMLHNHPSGDPQPSEKDVDVTEEIRDALDAVGVELLDHVIIGDGESRSLRKDSYL